MTIHEKLIQIQSELKAPKGQYNSFGKYKYRNCEDILEAVKPLLKKQGLAIRLSDDIVMIGSRYYVQATAEITDGETAVKSVAFAREEESKKGMDGSQVTGAASSYARKYALNGLFAIDDTKDSDTTNNGAVTAAIDDTKDSDTTNNGAVTAQAERETYKCHRCGKEIKAIKAIKQGEKIISAESLYKRSKSKYGEALCVSCAKAKEEEDDNE